jgi:hypothetical protein
MLRSDDPNAEMRYLVEVDEDWQGDVLAKAFNGYFDKVADLQDGEIKFLPMSQLRITKNGCKSKSKEVARHIRSALMKAYLSDSDHNDEL